MDIETGKRTHSTYRLTTEAVLIQFYKVEYKVKELVTMRKYDIVMIQLTDVKNELNYHNWLGIPVPTEKGLPYQLSHIKGAGYLPQ